MEWRLSSEKRRKIIDKAALIRITCIGKAEWAQRSCEKHSPVRSVSQSSAIIGHQAMDTQRLYLIFCIFLPLFNIAFMFLEIRQRRSVGVELVLKNRADAREQMGDCKDFLLNLFYWFVWEGACECRYLGSL